MQTWGQVFRWGSSRTSETRGAWNCLVLLEEYSPGVECVGSLGMWRKQAWVRLRSISLRDWALPLKQRCCYCWGLHHNSQEVSSWLQAQGWFPPLLVLLSRLNALTCPLILMLACFSLALACLFLYPRRTCEELVNSDSVCRVLTELAAGAQRREWLCSSLGGNHGVVKRGTANHGAVTHGVQPPHTRGSGKTQSGSSHPAGWSGCCQARETGIRDIWAESQRMRGRI